MQASVAALGAGAPGSEEPALFNMNDQQTELSCGTRRRAAPSAAASPMSGSTPLSLAATELSRAARALRHQADAVSGAGGVASSLSVAAMVATPVDRKMPSTVSSATH